MMRKSMYIVVFAAVATAAMAQDTVINRNITVERDFQPIVQSAGKINQRPQVVESVFKPVECTYSDYTSPLSPAFNVSSLLSQPLRFSQPENYHGLLRGAFGHVRSDFDFAFRVDDGKKSVLDITAHHKAYWGRKTLENSTLAFNFTHTFSSCDVYIGVLGENNFYTRYGRYFDSINNGLTIAKYSDFEARDKQNEWYVDARVGIRSNSKSSEVGYLLEAEYSAYVLPSIIINSNPFSITEHTVGVKGNIAWKNNGHSAGANLGYKADFFALDSAALADSLYNTRHNIRIEPYYQYLGKRVLIHAGVNLDVNVGKGQMMSSSENISFAPSPNVRFEAQLAPKWATVYANATGFFGTGALRNGMHNNRYLEILPGIASRHVCGYTPIDAELGFRFRAHKNLLIEIHGGYALLNNQCTWIAVTDTTYNNLGYQAVEGDYSYFYSNYSRWKVGGVFTYHYQDIINIRLWGDYYAWSISKMDTRTNLKDLPYTEGRVYDRPSWEIGLRIDARIDSHWSLYSDNHFAGSRWALTTKGDVQLKPLIDVNLGLGYDFSSRLGLYLELNNYICRYNDIFFGYQTPGINGVIGATWRF